MRAGKKIWWWITGEFLSLIAFFLIEISKIINWKTEKEVSKAWREEKVVKGWSLINERTLGVSGMSGKSTSLILLEAEVSPVTLAAAMQSVSFVLKPGQWEDGKEVKAHERETTITDDSIWMRKRGWQTPLVRSLSWTSHYGWRVTVMWILLWWKKLDLKLRFSMKQQLS